MLTRCRFLDNYWYIIEFVSGLTEASKKTLVHQGGKMSPEEAAKFESSALFDAIIKMRTWDEVAKDPKAELESLTKYKQLCKEVLLKNK